MNLYGLFILDVNIKYIVFSILYRHINVPMACKELTSLNAMGTFMCLYKIEKTMYFKLTPNIKSPYKFT